MAKTTVPDHRPTVKPAVTDSDTLPPEDSCTQDLASLQSLVSVAQDSLSNCPLPEAVGFNQGYWNELDGLTQESLACYQALTRDPDKTRAMVDAFKRLFALLEVGLGALVKLTNTETGQTWYNYLSHLRLLVQRLICAAQKLSETESDLPERGTNTE